MATPPNPLSPLPLNQITYKKSDLEDESLTLLNSDLANIKATLNMLAGYTGPIKLGNHIDLQGNKITNMGPAESETDAVSQAFATANYGAEALRPQIDALGKRVLQSTRRINDRTQRERYSSFLNGVLNTAPTTNNSQIFASSPSGGTVSFNVTAGSHLRVDGTEVPYAGFSDTVTLPTSYPLATLVRAGGVVTAMTSGVNPFTAGETITIPSGGTLSDPTFAGTFVIQTIVTPGSVFKYVQIAPDASATGGTASLGSVYYYFIQSETNVLARSGPFSVDSWQNRRLASQDGQTIIAVVVINSHGVDVQNSAAGATPPAQNNNIRLFGRL